MTFPILCRASRRIAAVLSLAALTACGVNSGADPLAAARKHLEKRDNRAAIVELKAALQKRPDAAAVRFLLGKTLLDAGDAVTALVELRKALELGHPEADCIPSIVKAMAVTGRALEATNQYSATKLDAPAAMAELQVALAAAWGIQGRNDQMGAAIDRALALEPRHATAKLVKARLLAERKDFDNAWKLTEEALQQDPSLATAWHFKGLLLRHIKGDEKGAAVAVREALKHDPALLPAHAELLSMMYQAQDKQGMRKHLAVMQKALPNNINTYLFKAQIEYLDNNLRGARELLQQLLRAKQPDRRVLMLAAQIEFRNGALTVAETYLTRVLNEDPTLATARQMLASTQMRLGQPDKALSTLQPLIESSAPAASTLAMAAEAFLHAGNPAKAQAYFERAAQVNPEDMRLRAAVALNRIAQGAATQGLLDLERAAERDKGTFADMALISTLLRRNDLDGALAAVDRLEKKESRQALPSSLRGQILLQRKDREGARKSFERGLEIDPSFYPCAAALAAMDLEDKQIGSAKKRFEAVLERDASNYRARLALADLKLRNGEPHEQVLALVNEAVRSHPGEVEPRTALIEYHLANRAHKPALSAAQEALAAIPDNPMLLDALGRAQFGEKEYQQAISTFRKSATLQPNSPQPHLRLAEVHAARDERGAAIASLQRALEISPNLLAAQIRQVRLYLAEKNGKAALAVARRVQQGRPKEGIGYLLEGDVHTDQRQWEGAAAALRTALSRTPSTEAAVKLHTALLQLGKKDEATKLAGSWRGEHPKDMLFVLHLANEAMKERDWARGEVLYREMLVALPDHVSANNNIAWCLMHQKKPGALAYAEKASRQAPKSTSVLDTLASALADAGQVTKALELQKKVVATEPVLPEVRLNLARIAIQAGDKKLARAELEKLAYEGDKFSAQAEVAQLLRSLQ